MLGIVLTVLKVIGIILLCLISILLFLILMLLFVPIRYGARVKYKDGLLIQANIGWLLNFICLEVHYEKGMKTGFKILGFPLGRKWRKRKKLHSDTSEVEREEDEPKEYTIKDGGEEEFSETLKKDEKAEDSSISEEEENTDKKRNEAYEPKGRFTNKNIKNKKKRKKKSLKEKFLSGLKNLKEKCRVLLQKAEKLKKILRHPRLQKGLQKIWKAACRLLRHILPKKIRGKFLFGFEDPYTTGQILSYAALFYPAYKDSIELVPIFNQSIIEADLQLKGSIQIFHILWILGRLWFDKDFKYVYKKFRAMRK